MKWGRKPPVKVEVEGYATVYVRVLKRGEARELLAEKFAGQLFPAALLGLALCDADGNRTVPGTIEEAAAAVEAEMEEPLFEAAAAAARDATFTKKTDQGKAEATPGGGST